MATIAGKTLAEWENNPLIKQLVNLESLFWINQNKKSFAQEKDQVALSAADIDEAAARLDRFAPWIAQTFSDTQATNGLIESPYTAITNFQQDLAARYHTTVPGKLYLKRDDLLPIAGTIKARGAIYEVLVHAETLALENGLLTSKQDDYTKFGSPQFQQFFHDYRVVVGTTGNLGISVGVMAAALGFEAIVHVSSEAKQWKKTYLQEHGVKVVEHKTNFTQAVAQGRQAAEADPQAYFVDDENSQHLFLGYTTAAQRLKQQLAADGIVIDAQHPLFLYLPCGVGGSPGGIAFGAKYQFGDNVYAFFAEPTHVPSLLLGLLTKQYANVSVTDFGIDGKTVMDGLAVPRTSQFVAQLMAHFFDGGYTLTDETANLNLARLYDTENIFLEPAATAGLSGPAALLTSQVGQAFLAQQQLTDKMANAVHIAWATGGSMVPAADRQAFYQAGK